MNSRNVRAGCLVIGIAGFLAQSCGTSPTGRSQLTLFSSEELNQMGQAAFQEMRQEQQELREGPQLRYVQCITGHLLEQVPRQYAELPWEVAVFDDDSINAFAVPGGKIGVHTGLLDLSGNQHQLATVIGHEIAHVIAGHGNERMSQQFATAAGMELAAVIAGDPSPQKDMVLGALGLGAQVGILLPFSRAHETEADTVGLELMAQAGFDPRQSIALWRSMGEASPNGPPELLSTHPVTSTRIAELERNMPQAVQEYEQARAAGRSPACD